MGQGTPAHFSWCAPGCEALQTGMHVSTSIPVTPTGTEILGVAVRLEVLADIRPISAVVVEFTVDGETTEHLLPVPQARALQRALGTVLRLVTPDRPVGRT